MIIVERISPAASGFRPMRLHRPIYGNTDTDTRSERTKSDSDRAADIPYDIRVGNTSEHVDPPPSNCTSGS